MRQIICFITIFLLCSLTAGCFRAQYPKRNQYLFDISTPQKIQKIKPTSVLEIDDTSIAPQFSTTNFVYRIGEMNYITDYYNTFFSPPARQINQIVTRYLSNTNLFRYVTNDDDYDQANYLLHVKILELYADYQDKKNPKGVMTIQFTLFKPKELKAIVLMNKTFEETIPLAKKDNQTLMQAWNQGLERILKRLTRELCFIVNYHK